VSSQQGDDGTLLLCRQQTIHNRDIWPDNREKSVLWRYGVTRSWLTSPDPFDIVFELLYLLLECLNSPFDALPLNLW